MHLNYFSVRIPQGYEDERGYVHMKHNQIYHILLRNNRNLHAVAKVFIDGKEIGTHFMPKKTGITLERPMGDNGKFTFYRLDSSEGKEAELEKNSSLGLISVVFTPIQEQIKYQDITRIIYEYPVYIYKPVWLKRIWQWDDPIPNTLPIWYYENTINTASASNYNASCCSYVKQNCCNSESSCTYKAGGTGLSGNSNQEFYENDLENKDQVYLYEEQTTIHLRLINSEQSGKKIRKLRGISTCIPEPIL